MAIPRILKITLLGAVMSSGMAMVLGRRQTGAYGPGMNCTAHWLYGDGAAHVDRAGGRVTLVGLATNAAATLFWSWLYDRALGRQPGLMRRLVVTAALGPVAYMVDYKATPKRFTPGWELVMAPRSMALVYLSMVIGMALGARRRGTDAGAARS
ncbi:hypothetical protein [Komagataeibacter sp. FNDCF1]|uniref:hypothetical protein n=1 Tax=Komagataeibacter sp. FNDCF1 TaxID=2878681 RepID=UPI001E432A56|nr:hypothetical protein [Komagataeibacter sp. FNDCF1]MCE2564130.1 hypothetical protein [Komagataeibacter sp. FNDCF1]